MEKYYSTRQVAIDVLGVKPDALSKAIWQGRVTPPTKSPSGQFLWTLPYIESAAWAMGRFEQFKKWEEQNHVE